MKWLHYVTFMEWHSNFISDISGEDSNGRPRHTWEDKIKTELKNMVENVDWMKVHQVMVQWRSALILLAQRSISSGQHLSAFQTKLCTATSDSYY
jgi:hypothetical protein